MDRDYDVSQAQQIVDGALKRNYLREEPDGIVATSKLEGLIENRDG